MWPKALSLHPFSNNLHFTLNVFEMVVYVSFKLVAVTISIDSIKTDFNFSVCLCVCVFFLFDHWIPIENVHMCQFSVRIELIPTNQIELVDGNYGFWYAYVIIYIHFCERIYKRICSSFCVYVRMCVMLWHFAFCYL